MDGPWLQLMKHVRNALLGATELPPQALPGPAHSRAPRDADEELGHLVAGRVGAADHDVDALREHHQLGPCVPDKRSQGHIGEG